MEGEKGIGRELLFKLPIPVSFILCVSRPALSPSDPPPTHRMG